MLVVLLGLACAAGKPQPEMKLPGHMQPWPDEELASPVRLACGVTIVEWTAGSPRTPAVIAKLDAICSRAVAAFPEFALKHHLPRPRMVRPFTWPLSLIPEGACYRCLNDTEYRFSTRAVHWLWGYTSRNAAATLMLSDTDSPVFERIFTHEIWHAMSMYYGVFEQHAGGDDEKIRADEALAEGFTRFLGLGG